MARWGFAATLVFVFALMGLVPASAQAPVGIGYVNTDAILRQTPGYDAADSTLAAERAVYQQEMAAFREQLDSAQAAFDQQQLVLSPQAREERVNELQALLQRAQTRENEIRQQDQDRQRELVAPLEARIQLVIDGIRAERNLAIVFDVANPNSAIISADLALDLTQLVITRLQASGGQ